VNGNRRGLQKKKDRQRAKVISANLLLVLPYLCGAVLISSQVPAAPWPQRKGFACHYTKNPALPFSQPHRNWETCGEAKSRPGMVQGHCFQNGFM